MTYERKNELLRSLAATAFESDSAIKPKIEQMGANQKDALLSDLLARGDVIWAAVGKEIEEFEQAQKEFDVAKAALHRAPEPDRPFLLRVSTLIFRGTIACFCLALAAFIAYGFIAGWAVAWGRCATTWGMASLGGVISVAWLSFGLRARVDATYEETRRARIRHYSERLGVGRLQSSMEAAREGIKQALLVRGVAPELNELIGKALVPSYETKLASVPRSGLAEVPDASHEIPTAARAKLMATIDAMPGGSIGIAGPRGCGKTTLVESVCSRGLERLKNRPVVAVRLQAPVEYVSREFVLHLFATICRRVEAMRSPRQRVDPEASDHELHKAFVKYQPAGAALAKWSGILLLAIGLSFVGLLSVAREAAVRTTAGPGAPRAASPGPAVGTTTAPAVGTAATGVAGHRGSGRSADEPEKGLLESIGLEPGPFLLWGAFFLAAAYASGIARRVVDSDLRSRAEWRERQQQSRGEPDELVFETRRWLDEIRYQRSVTTGWSLKLPVGLEAEVTNSVATSRQPLSLPEIVDGYRDYLRLLAREHEVIVGIDELDKIESDERAHRFLNEIKSLFGLDHCFYLLSVSESAISAFERRGLSFRDALDSAFDTIIYVDYLDAESAQRLLQRRVIGLPIPFQRYCYCMSGGLPRDLIRVCRDLLERARSDKTCRELESLSKAITAADLVAKRRALSFAASPVAADADVDRLLGLVHNLPVDGDADRLYQAGARLVREARTLQIQSADSDSARERKSRSRALAMEAGVYAYFCATVISCFEKPEFTAKVSNELFDALARARQIMGNSPEGAIHVIDSVRGNAGLRLLATF